MNNSGTKIQRGLFVTLLMAVFPLKAGADDAKINIETSRILKPVILNAKQQFNEIERIPFSISEIHRDTIAKAGVSETRSLVRQIPNVNYSDSGLLFANTITMRGGGSSSALIFPSVNYYVDGVPIPTRMFDMPFGDVEKIAIFRGPQGTTGGLNSQAGSINIDS